MNKMKKFALIAVCAALLVCVTIGATVAWLTAQSDEVTNTFTVGKVAITLDEKKVDENGVPVEGATRVTTNSYKLLPGSQYEKDPTVHITAGSEPCIVFVEVKNEIAAIETASSDTVGTIADQMAANDWVALGDKYPNIYCKATVNTDGSIIPVMVNGGEYLPVFERFAISGNVDGDTLNGYKDKTITIKAYAIQYSDTSAESAWEDLKPAATPTPGV